MFNMMNQPLRYKICRWPQAVKCLSNNSRNLYISVTELVNNKTLEGTLIKVEHAEFGTLFAAVAAGSGEIVTKNDDDGNLIPWMSTNAILQQLAKFGFYIYYKEISSLDDDTIDYLMKAVNLGYDKITKLVVEYRENGRRIPREYVVALNSKQNEDLLGFGMHVTGAKFTNRITAGKLITLQDNGVYQWDWLDSIYNINDVLEENQDIEEFESSEPQEDPIMVGPVMDTPEGFTLYDESDEESGE